MGGAYGFPHPGRLGDLGGREWGEPGPRAGDSCVEERHRDPVGGAFSPPDVIAAHPEARPTRLRELPPIHSPERKSIHF
jgi:hypothetical protein